MALSGYDQHDLDTPFDLTAAHIRKAVMCLNPDRVRLAEVPTSATRYFRSLLAAVGMPNSSWNPDPLPDVPWVFQLMKGPTVRFSDVNEVPNDDDETWVAFKTAMCAQHVADDDHYVIELDIEAISAKYTTPFPAYELVKIMDLDVGGQTAQVRLEGVVIGAAINLSVSIGGFVVEEGRAWADIDGPGISQYLESLGNLDRYAGRFSKKRPRLGLHIAHAGAFSERVCSVCHEPTQNFVPCKHALCLVCRSMLTTAQCPLCRGAF